MACVGKIASLSCAIVKASDRAFITNGLRTSWKLARSGLLAIQRVLPQLTKSKTCAERPVI